MPVDESKTKKPSPRQLKEIILASEEDVSTDISSERRQNIGHLSYIKNTRFVRVFLIVSEERFELSRVAPPAPKAGAYANSATPTRFTGLSAE